MKLIISLFFLIIIVESMKIQTLHKMNNFFKKSLLNLNNFEDEELGDILEPDNNDNSKIYNRQSPRSIVYNTTSLDEAKDKVNHAINFTKFHEAFFNHTELTTPPTTSSIFTNNKNLTHTNSINVKNSSILNSLEKKKVKEINKTKIHFTQQLKEQMMHNYSEYNLNDKDIRNKGEPKFIKTILNKNNSKEVVQELKHKDVPIFAQNKIKQDNKKNEFTHDNLTEHENLEANHSHPLNLGGKTKNETLPEIRENTNFTNFLTPKKQDVENKSVFDNKSKNPIWKDLYKNDEYKLLKNNLNATNKNTHENYENNETKKTNGDKEIKTNSNVELKEFKETKQNQQENQIKVTKENKTHLKVSSSLAAFNNTLPFMDKSQNYNYSISTIKQDTIINKSHPNSTTEYENNSNSLINGITVTQSLLDIQKIKEIVLDPVDKNKKECAELKHTIKNETESAKQLFEDKLINLKKSIKNSFNQLLLQNQENLEENKKHKFDMLNNLDTLIKSLVNNVTHSYQEQINHLHSETINQLKELKEAVKVNKIQEKKKNHKNINNSVIVQKEEDKNKKNKLKQPKNLIKIESNQSNNSHNLNDIIKNIAENEEKNKTSNANIIQESSNLRNKNKNQVMQKPVYEKGRDLNEDENFTNKFLANVISKLISHPLHIDSDEVDNQTHSSEKIEGGDKPNIMIISNSSGTKIENKKVNNYNSHNTRIYNK